MAGTAKQSESAAYAHQGNADSPVASRSPDGRRKSRPNPAGKVESAPRTCCGQERPRQAQEPGGARDFRIGPPQALEGGPEAAPPQASEVIGPLCPPTYRLCAVCLERIAEIQLSVSCELCGSVVHHNCGRCLQCALRGVSSALIQGLQTAQVR